MSIRSKKIVAVHPGEIIASILDELGASRSSLAKQLKVSPAYISDIVNKKRGLSAEMAFKLSVVLGSSPTMWMDLQKNWELSCVDQKRLKNLKKLTPTKIAA